jgi:hypothetical protein
LKFIHLKINEHSYIHSKIIYIKGSTEKILNRSQQMLDKNGNAIERESDAMAGQG